MNAGRVGLGSASAWRTARAGVAPKLGALRALPASASDSYVPQVRAVMALAAARRVFRF